MITSTSNSRVQWIRSLQRRRRARQQEGAFVIEGTRLVEEAFRAGVSPRLIVHGPRLDQRTAQLVDGLAQRGAPMLLVSDHVLAACASTETPQGLLAVLSFPEVPVPVPPTLALIAEKTRLLGPLPVPERPAEHNLDYRTHFERRTRKNEEPVYRAEFEKRA